MFGGKIPNFNQALSGLGGAPAAGAPGGLGALFQNPMLQQMLLQMGLGMMANSGGSPGRPGMGFGQGMGQAGLSALQNIQQMQQLSMANNMAQKRLTMQEEAYKREAEDRRLAREQDLQMDQARMAQVAALEGQKMKAQIERDKLAAAERQANAEYRTTMAGKPNQAIGAYVDAYVSAYGDTPEVRQMAIEDYNKNQRNSADWPFDTTGNNTDKTGGTDVNARTSAAADQVMGVVPQAQSELPPVTLPGFGQTTQNPGLGQSAPNYFREGSTPGTPMAQAMNGGQGPRANWAPLNRALGLRPDFLRSQFLPALRGSPLDALEEENLWLLAGQRPQ